MITKAVVVEVVDIYRARVRIPVYNQIEGAAAATPNNQLYVATISTSLGIRPAIKVGDVVFVAFEDNQLQQPIILGALAREDDTTSSNIQAQTLEVDVAATLPLDTTIGNIEASKIKRVVETYNDVENRVETNAETAKYNGEEIKKLQTRVTQLETTIANHEARIKALEEKLAAAITKGCTYLK